jgi:hypothetical protein
LLARRKSPLSSLRGWAAAHDHFVFHNATTGGDFPASLQRLLLIAMFTMIFFGVLELLTVQGTQAGDTIKVSSVEMAEAQEAIKPK